MPDQDPTPDYERLTIDALAAAAAAETDEQRHLLLDQAAIYAALGEKTRGYALTGR
ncbi:MULTISPECIES: hypothetical protein [Sphingomonas]|jgi:hypothetical protein|nr:MULTISPECIES: hypothetical protein [Sphingomonas]MBD8551686.1 hypothetical protein [Sphingomonas sp. CFBP 8764]MBD8639612.1 hypothetical protein [Sphingomonas sp. CFBP 13733]MDY0967545.1 hypothetical protein [Sphingomonas sp. CFBP9021]MDY1009491.1 hypothetical protein [Sphingomonas sp. CFBP9019]USR00941.1 hypothetical protein NEF64_03535 [Sphingomonas aerolata]